MNFNQIVLKMLRVNYKRYLLYFICNVFSITLFFSFAALFTNNSFMHNPEINSSISNNIIAPSYFVSIFIILFVPYFHNAFQKLRRNDYGVFLTLGMTEKEILMNLLFENGIIALISLAFGLLIGTVISACFYEIIIKVIGISALSYKINGKAYEVTILFYGAVFIVTVIISIFQLFKMKIVDLIKERYKGDKGKNSSRIMFFIGILMLIVAMIFMIRYYDLQHINVWFYSMIICFVGTYLIISNSDIIILWIEKNKKNYYLKNILFFSDLKYHFHSIKKVLIATIWLFEFTIFFIVLSIITYPSLCKDAITYTPYQMEFVQMYKTNQISDKNLEEILNSGDTKVTEKKSMEFLRNGAFNILSESQVNTVLKHNYNIKKGTFLEIIQYDLHDGYAYGLPKTPQELIFACNNKDVKLKSAGSKVDILVDKNYMADRTIMVNDDDFEQIKKTSKDYMIGVIKLFNFEEWTKSGKIIETLQQKLNKINHVSSSDLNNTKITSRIEEYKIAKQSASFLIILMVFILILFWLSANIILHLKLQLEVEDERRKYRNLYEIGTQEKEIKNFILYKHSFMFLVPVFVGAIIAMFYSYSVFYIYGFGWMSIKYCGLISMIIIIIQIIFVKIYTSSFSKKLLKEILR